MLPPDKMQKNADECFERAGQAGDTTQRTQWLDMAQYWLRQIEKASGKKPPTSQEIL
jgi:hypothetical protein